MGTPQRPILGMESLQVLKYLATLLLFKFYLKPHPNFILFQQQQQKKIKLKLENRTLMCGVEEARALELDRLDSEESTLNGTLA